MSPCIAEFNKVLFYYKQKTVHINSSFFLKIKQWLSTYILYVSPKFVFIAISAIHPLVNYYSLRVSATESSMCHHRYWFIRYIYCCNLQSLNTVITIKTKVLLPQVNLAVFGCLGPQGILLPNQLNDLTFQCLTLSVPDLRFMCSVLWIVVCPFSFSHYFQTFLTRSKMKCLIKILKILSLLLTTVKEIIGL